MSGAEDPAFAALQAWFGRALAVPFPLDATGNPLEAAAPDLRAEADALLAGPGGFTGFDRLGVYHRQYWFRLVGIMQADYACAVHVMGLEAYNAWAIRYLAAHPPASPYLARLDDAWPDFLEGAYDGPGRAAVLEAVAFDRAFSRAFDAPDGEPLDAAADPLALRIVLAPHAAALSLGWDFPAFREACLADEGLEAAIPLPPGPCRVVVWRGRDRLLWQQRLAPAAYKVLAELRAPSTVEEVFARLEDGLDAGEREDLEANLAAWFADWVRAGILAAPGAEADAA